MQTEEVKEVTHTWEDDIPLVKDEDSQIEVDAIGTVAPDDAYEVRTRHSFATHPVSKGVIVLGASFMLMSILGIFIKALTGGFSNSENVAKVAPQTTPTPSINQNSISEADTLKAKLMFNEQRQDIGNFNRQKQAGQRKQASSSTVPQPTPVQSVPVTVAPRRIYAQQIPYSPQIPSRQIVPIPRRSSSRSVIATPPPTPPLIATSPPARPDPMAQWLAAANVGSYGNSSPTNNSQTTSSLQSDGDDNYQAASYQSNDDSAWEASGGTGTPAQQASREQGKVESDSRESFVDNSTSNLTRQSNTDEQAASYSDSANSLIVGTKANGKLTTAIAWSGKLENPTQNFLIQLSEPLTAADSTVAVPKGTYLVAKVMTATEAGLLQMSVSSMLVNENGQKTEKPVPEGALLILGKGGRPLKASAERPNTNGNDLGTVVLSGVANATGLVNRSSSASIYSSNGYQSTITNSNPNYLAGFGEGAAQSLLQQAQNRNQQALRYRQSEPTVFVLNQGASVQIFVNQSVSLANP